MRLLVAVAKVVAVANVAKTVAKAVATIAKASRLLIQHQGQLLCKEACPIKLVTKCYIFELNYIAEVSFCSLF